MVGENGKIFIARHNKICSFFCDIIGEAMSPQSIVVNHAIRPGAGRRKVNKVEKLLQ